MAHYFDSVRNPSTFRQKVKSEKPRDFSSLRQTAVSLWRREHLFALRVLCTKPTSNLAVLEPYLRSEKTPLNDTGCIQRLIDGPDHNINTLSDMSEPQIVRSYNPDSLGSVWAAFGSLLRPKEDQSSASIQQDTTNNREVRNRQPREGLDDYVPSSSIQIGSSPPGDRPSSSGTDSSIGYTQSLEAPAVEDLTLRLASCFVRLVLNYGQELPNRPILEFRDERLSVSYQLPVGLAPMPVIQAIDDGGVRMLTPQGVRHVALVEAKRCFQVIEDGKPAVSDGLLAQMAGEALLLLLDENQTLVSGTSMITIHAAGHYVKFFHFETTKNYLDNFESLTPHDDGDDGLYLYVHSTTDWFDMATKKGREMIVNHLLALVQWAHDAVEQAGEEDEDMEMEDE